MGLKKLLGLETFKLTEREIIHRIKEAQQKRLSEIEFKSPKKNVKVKLKGLEMPGIMRDNFDYYAK